MDPDVRDRRVQFEKRRRTKHNLYKLRYQVRAIGSCFRFGKITATAFYSGREYENLIMDCCQMEDNSHAVKREEVTSNDPENGSPDADRGGTSTYHPC